MTIVSQAGKRPPENPKREAMIPTHEALLDLAKEATKLARPIGQSQERTNGLVVGALIPERGKLFTGVNIDVFCGMGFCAEHSAIAEMVKGGESRIAVVAAATAEGRPLPPCGRCREMIYCIDKRNLDTT